MAKKRAIPLVDLLQFTKGDEKAKKAFIKKLGTAFHDIGSVSYTHLDVYKRQTFMPAKTPSSFIRHLAREVSFRGIQALEV